MVVVVVIVVVVATVEGTAGSSLVLPSLDVQAARTRAKTIGPESPDGRRGMAAMVPSLEHQRGFSLVIGRSPTVLINPVRSCTSSQYSWGILLYADATTTLGG